MQAFLAHLEIDTEGNRVEQTCQDHCKQTAIYAKNSLSDIGLGETAYLAGILHDCGKYTGKYQNYIEKAASGVAVKRGSVNHTFAGVRFILEKYHKSENDAIRILTSEIIAYAIGAHHGLFDCVNEEHKSGFEHRLTKEGIAYSEALHNFLNDFPENEIENAFQKSKCEINNMISVLGDFMRGNNDEGKETDESEISFYLGMLTRLVLSAVVDGDRQNTSDFYSGSIKQAIKASREMWENVLSNVENQINQLDSSKTINKARAELSEMCKSGALNEPGVYRLDMPTGSGKTLSSLRYAIAHASKWDKKRIIFVTPLLSILDQNASIIRKYIGDDSIILEHHSNIIRPSEDNDEYDMWEYYTETWNVPVIITTMVQFLNTLFSGKMSAIRRMNALCDSVIVIDEVQTVPVKMLSLFNTAVNFLTTLCKTTVILSSATQPSFEKVKYPLRNIKGDVVRCGDDIRELFKRTVISQMDRYTLENIVEYIPVILRDCESLLVVCNKKNEAQYLFKHLELDNCSVFHLSASMCIQHRKDVLEDLRIALGQTSFTNKKVICISTQVIEAGVDISFERAIRFTAGMDSVIQTAGRCNRNGECDGRGDVFIFSCVDENLDALKEIKLARMATEELLAEYSQNATQFQDCLDSKKAIDYYYMRFLNQFSDNYNEYVLRDNETIYNLLSQNMNYVGIVPEVHSYYLQQAFSKAGTEFKVFDSDSVDVIVPYKDGKSVITDLASEKAAWNENFVKIALEKAKKYAVALYSYQIKKLEEFGALYELNGGRTLVLQQSFYDDNVGVVEENKYDGYLEVGQ